jgi:hypothetical protein
MSSAGPVAAGRRPPRPWMVEIDVGERLPQALAFLADGLIDGRFFVREKPIEHRQARRRQQIVGAVNGRGEPTFCGR